MSTRKIIRMPIECHGRSRRNDEKIHARDYRRNVKKIRAGKEKETLRFHSRNGESYTERISDENRLVWDREGKEK